MTNYYLNLQESEILKYFTSKEELEPLAENCTKVYVWHTRTQKPAILNAKKMKRPIIPDNHIEVWVLNRVPSVFLYGDSSPKQNKTRHVHWRVQCSLTMLICYNLSLSIRILNWYIYTQIKNCIVYILLFVDCSSFFYLIFECCKIYRFC